MSMVHLWRLQSKYEILKKKKKRKRVEEPPSMQNLKRIINVCNRGTNTDSIGVLTK